MDDLDVANMAPALQNLSPAEKQEVVTLMQRSQQQAQVSEIVHSLSGTCFAKCVTGKITTDSLSSGETSCAQNCVGRWLDAQTSILKSLSGQQQAAPSGKGFFG